jgi:WD40 repeat protein
LRSGAQPAWRPCFSDDGRYLALTHHARDGPRRPARFVVWDLERRAIAYRLDELPTPAYVDFAPDRPVVALATEDGRLFERDLEDGGERTIARFEGGARPNVVSYSPDGERLAVTVWGAAPARIFARDGELLGTVGDPDEWILHAAWSPDGTRLALACTDIAVRVRDVESGEITNTLRGHQGELGKVMFPRDDLLVSFAWDQTTRLWSLDTDEEILGSDVKALVVSADGSRLGSRTDFAVLVQELRYGDVLRSLHAHEGERVLALAVDPTGRLAASGGVEGLVVWDLQSGERVDERAFGEVEALAFAGDAALYVAAQGRVARWELEDGKLREGGSLLAEGDCRELVRSRDGSLLAARMRDRIRLWRAGIPEHELSIPPPPGAGWLSVSPGGEWIAVGSWRGSGVRVYRSHDGALVAHLVPEERVCTPHFSPDGTRLAIGTRYEYHLHRTGTWERQRTLTRGGRNNGAAMVTRFSPDGSVLATAAGPDRIVLFESDTGRELLVLEAPGGPVPSEVRFTPDGRSLLVGVAGRILVWDLERIAVELADGFEGSRWATRAVRSLGEEDV